VSACSSDQPIQTVPLGPAPTGSGPAAPGPGTAATAPGSALPGAGSGTATIDAFDLPSDVPCTPPSDAEVTVHFATTGAKAVRVLVDGTAAPATGDLSGTATLRIPCDDAAHTVVLVAVDPSGGTSVKSKVVLTGSNS
jgi:hypothetical protein